MDKNMTTIDVVVGNSDERTVWVEVAKPGFDADNIFLRAEAAGFRLKMRIANHDREVWLFRCGAEINEDIGAEVLRCEEIIRGYHEAIPVPETVVKASKTKASESPTQDLELLLVAHLHKTNTERARFESEIGRLYLEKLRKVQAKSRNREFKSLDVQQVAQLLVDHWSEGDFGFNGKMVGFAYRLDQRDASTQMNPAPTTSEPDASTQMNPAPTRSELKKLSTSELRQAYLSIVGRPTKSTNRDYLLWKIGQVLKGKIKAGGGDRKKGSSATQRAVIPHLRPRAGSLDARLSSLETRLQRWCS